tara:strand:- start:51 stop:437 length:387 start_codon:yes stop_codon:yes gene_type:complete
MTVKQLIYEYLDKNYPIEGDTIHLGDTMVNVSQDIRDMFGTNKFHVQQWARERAPHKHIIHETNPTGETFTHLEGDTPIKMYNYFLFGTAKTIGTYVDDSLHLVHYKLNDDKWVQITAKEAYPDRIVF